MPNEREMYLEEIVERDFPKGSGPRMRLDALLWKEAHPLREFWRQVRFKIRMLLS